MLLKGTPGNPILLKTKTRISKVSLQVKFLFFPHVTPFPGGVSVASVIRKLNLWQGTALLLAALSQAWTEFPLLSALSTMETVWNFPSAVPKNYCQRIEGKVTQRVEEA